MRLHCESSDFNNVNVWAAHKWMHEEMVVTMSLNIAVEVSDDEFNYDLT